MSRRQYLLLKELETYPGYVTLQELWMIQQAKLEEGRDKAAKRNNESAWRYWAGQEAGFKLAITQLQRAIQDLEREDDNQNDTADAILEELKIKGDTP